MSAQPDRRNLLRGLAAMPVLPAAALAATPDPIHALLEEEERLFHWWLAPDDDEEAGRRHETYRNHERILYATKPTTWGGLAALLALYVTRECLDLEYDPDLFISQMADHARTLAGEVRR